VAGTILATAHQPSEKERQMFDEFASRDAASLADAVPEPEQDDAAPEDLREEAQPEPKAEPEAATMIVVVELSGPYDGRGRPISGSALLGRDGSEVTLAFPYDYWISATHARIEWREGQWWLEDQHSRNGTWVEGGGRRLTAPEPIEPGVIFRIGHTDLTISPNLVPDNALAFDI
jgi:hypothetical protein